jgi:hypothetical protein
MDPNTQELVMGSAGVSTGPAIYVEDVFSTWLYTGNGGTQTITNGIDLNSKGGAVWTKSRSVGNNNWLYSTEQGSGEGKGLITNDTAGINLYPQYNNLSSFNSNGFTLGTSSYGNQSNENATTYTSWTFRKAPKFFDIITWVGNGSLYRNIPHNLVSQPNFAIVKRTDSGGNWLVDSLDWSLNVGGGNPNNQATLNSTSAFNWLGGNYGPWCYNSTSSNLTVGLNANENGATYVAYLFAHDAGGFGDSGNDSVVKCGSYTGNGSATGPFVNLGWEPQWILVKNATTGTDNSYSWYIHDTMRGWTTTEAKWLRPNTSEAEGSQDSITVSATGFRPTYGYNGWNANGSTYIYIAIRRGPMKTPTDATKVFNVVKTTTFSAGQIISGPPVVDLGWSKQPDGNNPMRIFDRLRGAFGSNTQAVYPNSTTVESNENYWVLDQNNGYRLSASIGGINYMHYMFSRAPKFLDIVTYTGNSNSAFTSQTLSHNLGVKPELIIIKSRSASTSGTWITGTQFTSTNYLVSYLYSNSVFYNVGYVSYPLFGSSEPTSTQFGCGNDSSAPGPNNTNESGVTYVAYLFASCPGVSKVGTYTGTGTTQQINCGFTSGARFVLIKRTDSVNGDWYLWDSARGITGGTEPYLLLNSSAAEVTGNNYIDAYAPGFELTSLAPSNVNGLGGSFLYLAVA